MSNDCNPSKFLELKIKCHRLEQENLYLRKLLNISVHKKINIPDDSSHLNLLNNTFNPNDKSEDGLVPSKILVEPSPTLSSQEKIQLFRRLFQGREDIYAIRWENKNGRSGYSPACANEWNKKLCRKPQIKCTECSNQKWLPLNDQAIHDHLTGKKFIGVYPLNLDDSCHFLAIDFDKETWEKDAAACFKICQKYSIPALLERSQSGHGAHIWVFFSQPLSARLARSLGTALLSKTMQEYHMLRMDSYDRLFPNQDTLPKGGFGNLIALPLQGHRRKEGKSIFLNPDLTPHPDPWSSLTDLKPISPQDVIPLLEQFGPSGDLSDIRTSHTDEEKHDPWITSHHHIPYPSIKESLPEHLELIRANLIYVPLHELPSKFIHCLKKLAAFHNPEFYRAQALRLSTYNKPRVIYCAEEFPHHLGLPRGCEADILKLFKHYEIDVTLCDKMQIGESIDVHFTGELYPEQKKAFKALIDHSDGVLCASTAFGKTVLAAKMIAERKTNTLILVHRQQLLEQWQERLSFFLDRPKKLIGTLSQGKNKLTHQIDIAMLQSLSKKEDEMSHGLTTYGQVIIDECHHVSAFSFEKILKKIKAKYILGLTATPIRKDGHHPIIFMQCGPIRYRSNNKSQIDSCTYQVYIRRTKFKEQPSNKTTQISDLYSALVINEERNEQIIRDVLSALEDKRKPSLLTERTQHIEWFKNKLYKLIKNIFILQGGMKIKERQEILKKILDLPHDTERLIIATGQYIGEGFDDSQLDTLFLTLPISWHGKLQQYVGRLHRFHQHKKNIVVYDYLDDEIPMLHNMYLKRFKKYKAMGYAIYEK